MAQRGAGILYPLWLWELQTWQGVWLMKRNSQGKVGAWQGGAGGQTLCLLALVSSRASILRDRWQCVPSPRTRSRADASTEEARLTIHPLFILPRYSMGTGVWRWNEQAQPSPQGSTSTLTWLIWHSRKARPAAARYPSTSVHEPQLETPCRESSKHKLGRA